jgi:hypothetical protein
MVGRQQSGRLGEATATAGFRASDDTPGDDPHDAMGDKIRVGLKGAGVSIPPGRRKPGGTSGPAGNRRGAPVTERTKACQSLL